MKSENIAFSGAEILLPDFRKNDGTRWAVVACDQYTSEPEYWEKAEALVGDAPSTLRMILPEVYLSESEKRIPEINREMYRALNGVLLPHPDAMIFVERTQSDGTVRRGIIGAVDLECYDYRRGSDSLIRATEGTVLERIPPRVAIRRDASIEFPHVMLLIDDPEKTVIEPLIGAKDTSPAYDFDLMLGGGHIRGAFLGKTEQARVLSALKGLIGEDAVKARYGSAADASSPLLFAVGDGNHSLASAKATYEEIKAKIGAEAAKNHPARYALAEVVNLHDPALQFEPIYRVVFGADPDTLLGDLCEYVSHLHGNAAPQKMTCVTARGETSLSVPAPEQQLTVGTLQSFLTDYTAKHKDVTVDYIHGEESLRTLAKRPGAVGFLFEGMRKDELFKTVICDGALPRKTFSMGHAQDKRYYLESRKIK